ncbi:MAG: metallophosphoesterase [Opitutaceae bacterium]
MPVDAQIFITSDWHLGGTPDSTNNHGDKTLGQQICRSAAQITEFIDWVRSISDGFDGITEIVINGDMVDFLSPDDEFEALPWTSDQDLVIKKLNKIIANSQDGNNRGPFEALAEFLNSPKCELTILLGNHDVELSLPKVRAHLHTILHADGKNYRFFYDGEAYTRGKLLVEHGNRYDKWNSLDHNGLRAERSKLSRGYVIDEGERKQNFFKAPAGTLIVTCAINSLLPEYPFLNLLKPETEAAIPILHFLKPERAAIIRRILSLYKVPIRARRAQLNNNGEPQSQGNLGGATTGHETLETIFAKHSLDIPSNAVTSGPLGIATTISDGYAWLASKAKEVQNTSSLLSRHASLALAQSDDKRLRSLQQFLTPLKEDNAFALEIEKDEYLSAAENLVASGDFEVVIFGHTHLPKKIELAENTGIYINAGAWADIMRLPDLALEDTTAGHQCLKDFLVDTQNGNIEKYIHRSLGYAEIVIKGSDITTSDLRSFCKSNPRGEPLEQYE